MKGYLLLETGDWFVGDWIGADIEMSGEVVFQTGMTGYQEVLTDPSYAGQIVTFTYPLIGNYGMSTLDDQSIRPFVNGVIVHEMCDEPVHSANQQTFTQVLEKYQIPGLKNVDTRELTKIIRQYGTLHGVITKTLDFNLLESFSHQSLTEKESLVKRVSIKKPLYYLGNGVHVVVIDYGSKFSIIEAVRSFGANVTVVPYNYRFEEIKKLQPDGIVFSNGPGDPKELTPMLNEVKKLALNFPTLGICLGHQVLSLAFGGETEKLPFGHRGVNHPVINTTNERVWITSQNHGFVVIEESLKDTDFSVTYRNVNDRTVEGMKHKYLPIESVQFHPEAHPGPREAFAIFRNFIEQVYLGIDKENDRGIEKKTKGVLVYA